MKGGLLSPDGTCQAFSDKANGFVRSEGAGMVLLKPLHRALEDGDRIYAVIRGSSTSAMVVSMTLRGDRRLLCGDDRIADRRRLV